MTKISRAAQALKEKAALETDRETARYLQELQESTARVLALVNEITALHNMLTSENTDVLLEQFNLADEVEHHS